MNETARILSVSYDEVLLRTRQMLLEREGYQVVSSFGFMPSLRHCKEGGFSLFILGHSIPQFDKLELVKTFRESCAAPVISLLRTGEQLVDDADYHIQPDPEPLVRLVSRIVGQTTAA